MLETTATVPGVPVRVYRLSAGSFSKVYLSESTDKSENWHHLPVQHGGWMDDGWMKLLFSVGL
jgi:hypothetical protein